MYILYSEYASREVHALSPPSAVHSIRSLGRPVSLSERIHADLRLRLQEGRIGPDERLVDLEIARAYGTSRMPVREALLRLVNEGYLRRTTRGFAVPTLDADDVRHLFEVRRLLEPEAAASAVGSLDAAAAAALGKALARARKAVASGSTEEMIAANIDFRAAWMSRMTNPRLVEAILRFVDHAQVVRLKTLGDARTRRIALSGLEALHAAFAARDRRAVRRCMKDFLLAAEHAFHDAERT